MRWSQWGYLNLVGFGDDGDEVHGVAPVKVLDRVVDNFLVENLESGVHWSRWTEGRCLV